jgi:O-antigen/teichoic acid export membrane protein
MLPAAAAASLLPRLAAETDTRKQIQLTRLALVYSTAAFALLACIVSISASWAIPFAYGDRFAGAVAPLVILTFAGLVIGAGGIIGTLLIALHQTRALILQVLIALAVNLATTAALIPAFGAVGVSAATLATETVSLVLLVVALERVAPGALAVWRASTTPVRVKPVVTV